MNLFQDMPKYSDVFKKQMGHQGDGQMIMPKGGK